MFHKTRIKLTLWYLLIIMLVSSAFSVVIYKGMMIQIEFFAREQNIRFERRLIESPNFNPSDFEPSHRAIQAVSDGLVDQAQVRLLSALLLVNGLIFVATGILGYVLAGKTLQPLKEMVEEQDRFVSDASHELRTPLTALRTSIEVYLREKQPTLTEAKKVFTESVDEVNKLQRLTDGLLQLAQNKSLRNVENFNSVGVSQIVATALRNVKPMAEKKHIELSQEVQPDMKVWGNEINIVDVLVILLDNAIKYSKPKQRVSLAAHTDDGHAVFTITDYGIGILPKDLPHIFDRFYRADSARTKIQANGYGLGLSIAKNIVEAHKGTIKVTSNPNKETVFTVILLNRKI